MNPTCLILATLALSATTPSALPKSDQTKPLDAAAARETMDSLNKIWGQARVSQDRETMEKMLAPGFYVQIGEQKISRKDFIDQSAAKSPGVKMKAFNVQVLTIQPRKDGALVAVIAEKLEVEQTTPNGKKTNVYSLWITKDTWKLDGDKWLALSSEASGFEYWRDRKPPTSVWGL